MFFSAFLDPACLDFTILSFIALLLVLSLLSLSFIFHLRLKSRTSQHLQHFNSLWTLRFLLVLFVSLWSVNELLRLSFFRRRYLYPFLPYLPILHQSTLCKLHSLFSLGLFQPSFLITLLLLINNASNMTNNTNTNTNTIRFPPIPFLLVISAPIFLLHIFIVFYSPTSSFFTTIVPPSFTQSYFLIKHDFHETTVLCSYPFFSSLAFSLFAIPYIFAFFYSSWKAASLVINKSLRFRVYAIAFTLLLSLPLQLLSLALSLFWTPDHPAYSLLSLLVFFSTFLCAAAGEGILVIVPIADSLAAHGWPHLPAKTTPHGCLSSN